MSDLSPECFMVLGVFGAVVAAACFWFSGYLIGKNVARNEQYERIRPYRR